MTAEGHLPFSVTRAVFARNAGLTPVSTQGDRWRTVPSTVLTCLLPDIDRPKSFLGRRLKRISKPIARVFGHCGFTHSLLAVFALLATLCPEIPEGWLIPADALRGMVLDYLSHMLADMLTPAGIPLLWSCHWRFRLPILVPQKGNQLERFICMTLFVWSVWIPCSLPENSIVHWSSQTINTSQIQFHRLTGHQVEYQKGKSHLSGISNSI